MEHPSADTEEQDNTSTFSVSTTLVPVQLSPVFFKARRRMTRLIVVHIHHSSNLIKKYNNEGVYDQGDDTDKLPNLFCEYKKPTSFPGAVYF
jgi:hypothetical protein